MKNAPERQLGTWHGTRASLGFWLKAIFTLGLWYLLVHKHNYIRLTTRRLAQVRGNFLTHNETSVDLEKISNIVVNKSALGKLFGYGDFIAETAGSDQSEVVFLGLTGPDKLRDTIFDIRDGKLDEVSSE